MTDLLVRGGLVVHPDGEQVADVLVRGGRIEAVAAGIAAPEGVPVLDAVGRWVLPGPIDSQVHFREPGLEHKEDLEAGSRAAVAGGVSAFLEMPNTSPSTTDPDALADKVARATGRCRADFAFFLGATAENADRLGEWEGLPGCAGVKVFMGSSTGSLLIPDDATLKRVLCSGRRRIAVHSEDEALLQERYAAIRPGTTVAAHPDVRSVECALRATNRLLYLVEQTGRRVHLLHVSTAEEMALLRERDLGDLVTVEVTPNHLFLEAPGCYEEHGSLAQMNPPVRDRRHQDALWQALADGVVPCVGSDHAPHTREEKALPYPDSPSGIPGVQTMLPLLLAAVGEGRLTRSQVVRLLCEAPARVYGIAGRGRLAPGMDGSLTVVDPSVTGTLTEDLLQYKVGWSPFVGRRLAGWPVATILRGVPTWRDGGPVGEPAGRMLAFEESPG